MAHHGPFEELPAVILANHGEKDANFLDINILREATSSQDTGPFQCVSCFAMSFRFNDVWCWRAICRDLSHGKFEVMKYWANLWCHAQAVKLRNRNVSQRNLFNPPVLLVWLQDLVLPAANVLMDKLDVTVDHDAGHAATVSMILLLWSWTAGLRLSNIAPLKSIEHFA